MWRYLAWWALISLPVGLAVGAFLAAGNPTPPPSSTSEQEAPEWPTETM